MLRLQKCIKEKKLVDNFIIKKMKQTIIDLYSDTDDIVFADGFDEAIIGFEPNLWKVVYSRNICIDILSKEMGEEEAIEY